MASRLIRYIVSLGFCLLLGCVASQNPLSISLYDPKAGVVRTCAARESRAGDISVLSSAVELCARQLEARGFVRVNDLSDEEKASLEKARQAPPFQRK